MYQGRFFSGPVEDVRAFWRTYKYIAQNPVKAGVASSVEAYRWSWLGRANEGVGLARPMKADATWLSNDDFSLDETKTFEMEATTKHGKKCMNDAEAQREIERLTGMKDAREFMSMNIRERERAVKVLVEAKMSPAQISRLTGMNRSTVYRVGKRG